MSPEHFRPQRDPLRRFENATHQDSDAHGPGLIGRMRVSRAKPPSGGSNRPDNARPPCPAPQTGRHQTGAATDGAAARGRWRAPRPEQAPPPRLEPADGGHPRKGGVGCLLIAAPAPRRRATASPPRPVVPGQRPARQPESPPSGPGWWDRPSRPRPHRSGSGHRPGPRTSQPGCGQGRQRHRPATTPDRQSGHKRSAHRPRCQHHHGPAGS